MPLPNDASARPDPASGDDPATALVEVGAGMAVLFADRPPSEMELIPFGMMGTGTTRRLTDRLSIGAGLVGAGAQGVQGVLPVQGLVRLAPRRWRSSRPRFRCRQGAGTWASSPRVTASRTSPVGPGDQCASHHPAVLARARSRSPEPCRYSWPPSLAELMRTSNSPQEILKELRRDRWNTLLGLYETTVRAVEEAQVVGVVNQHIYDAVKTGEADLRKERHVFSDFVKGHVKALTSNARSRNEYLRDHGEEIIADTHGLLMAEGSWFRSRVLRAASIAHDEDCAAEKGTRLLALADVNDTGHLIRGNAYLGVTPECFFLSPQSIVNSQGVIERQIPLADIRYVRTGTDRTAGPVLDVITKDENIRISFDAWAQEGERLEDARRLGNLLASAMNIPDEELCSDPLLPRPTVPKRQEPPSDPQQPSAPRRSG